MCEQLVQGRTRQCSGWDWTRDLQSQVQRPNHYATEPHSVECGQWTKMNWTKITHHTSTSCRHAHINNSDVNNCTNTSHLTRVTDTVIWRSRSCRSGLVVSTPDCGARGSKIEPALRTVSVFFHEKLLRYAALGTGCTLTTVSRSTQPSTLRGTVNEYQPYGWVMVDGDGRMFGL